MPITVFIILVVNELLEVESAKVVKKSTKSDDNAKSGGWVNQETDITSVALGKTFLRACRIIVPSILLCFIVIFFAVGLCAFNRNNDISDRFPCH